MFGQNWHRPPDEYTFWDYKFIWFPKECAISGKTLWLCRAYRGTKVITGPGDPVFLHWWHHPKEHFMWKLKGN